MLSDIVKVDPGRASELTQAKARLLQAQANYDAVVAKVREFELNLKKILGIDSISLPQGRWRIALGSFAQVLSSMEKHPSIAQAIAESEAAEAQADAIRASLRPQLNWTVSKTTTKNEIGQTQPWRTGFSINWAIFRGGSGDAAEGAARQRALASRQKKDKLVLDLEFKVRSSFQDASVFQERAVSYETLSVESDKVRGMFFEQWYHLGKRSLLDVLTAESEHYSNQVAAVTSRFDTYQAIARMQSSAGRLQQWVAEL
jgi:outer membrane protein TolC